MLSSTTVFCQTNFIDKYLTDPLTYTVIGTTTSSLNQPRDLDFKPNTNELWVCNYGTASGGSMVIFYNAGHPNQTSQYRKDTHSEHFMAFPSAFAFSDIGEWAAVGELKNNTGSATSTFMGPSLWLGDTNIFAKVCQNAFVTGLPLGSHIDMLHQSPYAMGIAFDSAKIYWVMDGWNGNICKYDFAQDHSPGYDNHSAGKIWRYTDVPVSRVVGVPSHMVLDKATGWLYFIDGGSKTIKRMNTHTGSVAGTLTVPTTANEPLASYQSVTGATVETIGTLTSQPCGIDFYNNRLIVSDYDSGYVYIYNTTATPTLLGTIQTGHIHNMGIKIGTDGKIWFVNKTESKVYRIDPTYATLDVAIKSIDAPLTENFTSKYYSTAFDVCSGNITPIVTIVNNGTTTITSANISFAIDGGTPTTYSWTGSIATGVSIQVTLPSAATTNGAHLLSVTASNPNGTTDDVPQNNILEGSFRTIDPIQSIPFTEPFSGATFPPAGWNYIHYNRYDYMSIATAGGFGLSTGSLVMNNFSGNTNISGQKDFFISPRLDFTLATTAAAALKFSLAYAQYNASSNDQLQVLASTDCGNTWSVVYDRAGTTLSTAPATTSSFTPSSMQWRTEMVSLSAYASMPEIELMFTSISNFGNNFYVDDISIGNIGSTTDIAEVGDNIYVDLFPNPTSDKINVTIENVAAVKNYTITIKNVLGEEIYSSSQQIGNATSIDASRFANGVYFVSVKANEKIHTQKLIIQH